MTKLQKIILSGLSVLACLSLLTATYAIRDTYLIWAGQPLAPPLDSTWELPATWTVTPRSPRPTTTLAPTLSFTTETPASPFLPCGDLPPMILLAIGSDAHVDDYRYGRADVIRAIRVDFRAKRVTTLAFPRDLWVQIPEVNDNLGTSRQKLNTAYIYGNPGLHFWDHPSQGPGLLARTLDLNFGLQADHYIAVSMNVFVEVVDALGGLDVTLPGGVDGRSSYDRSQRLVFPPGEQHLSGEQALTLARIRNVSTFARSDHQNTVLCALEEQINKPETLVKLPEILSSFFENIQTDLTPGQISQLACLGTTMPRRNIVFASFPRELFKDTTVYDPVAKQDVFIWESDFDELHEYVRRFEAGTWPSASRSPFATPEPETSGCE